MHKHRIPRVIGLLLTGLLVLGALALPAIAGHGDKGGEITAVDFRFQPRNLTIDAGTNVLFNNDGPNAPHTFSGTNGGFDSGVVFPGGEVVVSTEQLAPGSYNFFCRVHPDLMRGTLRVKG